MITFNLPILSTFKGSNIIIIFLIFILCSLSEKTFAQLSGSSIVLDGYNDYITVPDNNSLDITTTLTIETWINICDIEESNMVVSKLWCLGSQDGFYINIKNGQIVWHWDANGYCGDTPSSYKSTDYVITPNVWYHIAVVHTPIDVKLYLNGNLIDGFLSGGNYSTINNSSEPLKIGTYKKNDGSLMGFFKGRIDEFRMWDYALTEADIQNRINDPLSGNELGLVAYYDMDISGSGSGIILPNISENTGDINNGTTVGTSDSPFFLSNDISFENLDLGDDITTEESSVLLDASSSGVSFLWQDCSIYPTFTATSSGLYWVEVNTGSCSVRDSVYIEFLTSIACSDFPCGNNNEKVIICHVPPGNPANEHEICINPNAVEEHLAHGDYCGPCNSSSEDIEQNSDVSIHPNPFSNSISVKSKQNMQLINIYDIYGRTINVIKTLNTKEVSIQLNNCKKGILYVKITHENGNIEIRRIIKK